MLPPTKRSFIFPRPDLDVIPPEAPIPDETLALLEEIDIFPVAFMGPFAQVPVICVFEFVKADIFQLPFFQGYLLELL